MAREREGPPAGAGGPREAAGGGGGNAGRQGSAPPPRRGPQLAPAAPRPIDLGPPTPHEWLTTDSPHRARRAFADTVVHAGLPEAELVAHCELYATRWTASGLVRALEAAHRRRPLPPAARRLLAAHAEGVAA